MGKFDRAPVDRAAGGIVVDDDGRIAVVHRPRYDDWALPKGHVDRGESWVEAARREVAEETGVEAHVADGPHPVAYLIGGDVPKVVVFYVMRAGDRISQIDAGEVDEVAWWPVADAVRRLTYPIEAELVARLLDPDADPGAHRR